MQSQAVELRPEMTVQGGLVRGADRDASGVLAYKGIPFAAPPIGERRWHSPVPPEKWSGVRDARQYGSRCWSALENDPEPGPSRSEDCLTLNVWTAAKHASDKRPVMVWVHGGGFQFSSSADPSIDGTKLSAKGVVVVSFNYRVGVLGFLAHPELDKEGPSGNYGLQDQLAALKWVQANIAQFGGDPANVTIFGESAGAHAIGILMASPLAVGLFHKAIGESGAFWDSEHGSLTTFVEARERGTSFAKRVGTESVAALRKLPPQELNKAASWNFTQDPCLTAFSPSVDGYVVPGVPAEWYLRGQQLHIPLLAGWNGVEEWPFRTRALPHKTAEEFREAAARMFGAENLAKFLEVYPATTDDQANHSAELLIGDLTISEQTWQWLDLQSRTGHAPVYGYHFTYTSPYVPVAAHLTEVPFVFGTLTPQFIVRSFAPPAPADHALSDIMMAYWINFATKGDPNGAGLPPWRPYAEAGTVQNFGAPVADAPNLQLTRFQFLAQFRNNGVFPAKWRGL